MFPINDPAERAKQCFAENRNLFSDTKTAPEKFNLYNGLASLAETVQNMQREIAQLRQEVHQHKMQR